MEKREVIKGILTTLLLYGLLLQSAGNVHSSPFFDAYLSRFAEQSGGIGVDVISIPGGTVVWEWRAREPLVPASLVKILTSYAALKSMGPHQSFETSVYATQSPRGDTLPGNIWVRSEGDMFFTADKALQLALRLRSTGIRRIEGGVTVDNHYFSPPSQQICLDDHCNRSYNPVISGTSIDYNTITFRVAPGARTGAPAEVTWSPPGDYVQLKNLSRTTKGRAKENLQVRSTGMGDNGRERFELRGELSSTSRDPWEMRLNVRDPAAFFGHSFRQMLREAGVDVRGGVQEGMKPPQARKIASQGSDPLGDLLFGLNRFSNNFMAEMLLRTLGARMYGEPGTLEKGVRGVESQLLALGVPAHEVSLESGSGLSRRCRVSPRVFSRVLLEAQHDGENGPKFVSSLAANGEEGTLRRRLRGSSVTLRGKTGSLKDVVAFSGYVSVPGRGQWAVTVLLNDVKNSWEARETLYKFLEELPFHMDVQPGRGG